MINRANAKTRKNKAWTTIFTATLLAVLGITMAAPLVTVSAATPTPKQPFVWVDNNHSSAVDANNTVYPHIGYICPVQAASLTNSAGTAISKDAAPVSGSTIKATQLKEDGTSTIVDVPKCNSSTPASYAWVSIGGDYIMIVDSGSKKYDTQYCPIGKCPVGVRHLSSGVGGSIVFWDGDIKSMAVDPSKASVADAAIKAAAAPKTDAPKGDNKPTCESSGFTLNWVFCSLYEGLGDASGWILKNMIIPQLKTSPLCVSSTGSGCEKNDVTYKVWSNFRIYGDVILVLALLVIVFGQSIGGGLIDAYTAKKVLPRLLAAVIMLNLSIYIVAFLLDITNIIGGGIGELITGPLKGAGAFKISPSGVGISELGGAGALGLILGAGKLAGLFSFKGIALVFDVVLVPVFLLFLAIIATLAVRKAVILALVFVAPVAFALYALPNTEKYFKKWWEVLQQMLMVYPIIIVMFAISDVLSVTIMQPNAGANDTTAGINQLLSFVFLILPLALIPFSFKLAGGLLGQLHGALDGGRQKAHAFGEQRRERSKTNFKGANIEARQNRSAFLQRQASKGGALQRNTLGRGLKGIARGYGGYNVEAEAAAFRAQRGKELNDQIATGKDDQIRGLTVNKRTSARREHEGKVQYQSLGGAWVDEADVDAGHKRWGNDTYAQQTALSYEMRKASTEEELQNISNNYRSVAQGAGGWGQSDQQAGGSWIGAAFENQQQHLEYKHTDWKTGQMDAAGAKKYISEVYEKKGSYSMAQMGSNTIEKLKEAHSIVGNDTDSQQKLAGIAETFMSEFGAGGAGADPDTDEGGARTPGGGTRRQANTPGAAHTAERVRELAVLTGVHPPGGSPSGPYAPDHAPSPNQREQH